MPDPRVLIEACIDSVESAVAAEAGGARRVELCDNLIEGGTTPSAGTIAECRARIGIGGDFLYSEVEYEVMRRDIAHAKAFGADGVVLGLLKRDGTVDVDRTRPLVDAARPKAVTFHRAIDVARDPEEALDALVSMGVDRVLTSGQAPTALEGAGVIAGLVRRAAGRIVILPGGGVNEGNVLQVMAETGAREGHVRGTSAVGSAMAHRNPRVSFRSTIEADDFVLKVTDAERIRRMARLLAGSTG